MKFPFSKSHVTKCSSSAGITNQSFCRVSCYVCVQLIYFLLKTFSVKVKSKAIPVTGREGP
jgi:hypothetical protein